MKNIERLSTGFLQPSDELRQLILDNPTLPLLFIAGADACSEEYGYMGCSRVSAKVGEFLDCYLSEDNESIYYDREMLRDGLENIYDSFGGSYEEFKRFIDNKMGEYEPYWKKCIVVLVDN